MLAGERGDCPHCLRPYRSLTRHWRHFPLCAAKFAQAPPVDTSSIELHSSLARRTAHDELQYQVAWDLSELRYERGFSSADIDRIRGMVGDWDAVRNAGAHSRLGVGGLLAPGVEPEAVADALELNPFEGLDSAAHERSFAVQNMPYLEPRQVNLGTRQRKEVVVSFRMADTLQRLLANNKEVRHHVLRKSDHWKEGRMHRVTPTELHSFDDATAARWHAKLMTAAASGEENHVRLAGLLNLDDVEVLPPIHTPTYTHSHTLCTKDCTHTLPRPRSCATLLGRTGTSTSSVGFNWRFSTCRHPCAS